MEEGPCGSATGAFLHLAGGNGERYNRARNLLDELAPTTAASRLRWPEEQYMSLIAQYPMVSIVLSFLAGQVLTVALFGVCLSAKRAERI